jgi:hypothetical protein
LVGKPEVSTSGSAVDVPGLGTVTGRSKVTANVDANRRFKDGSSLVTVTVQGSDPLAPGIAPPTGGTFTVFVSPDGDVVDVSATIAIYPAFEGYIEGAKIGKRTLFQYSPVGTSANSPGQLLLQGTVDIKGKVYLRPKEIDHGNLFTGATGIGSGK